MKLKEALSLMKEQGLIDDGELYSYGQKASVLGGAAGAAACPAREALSRGAKTK